MKNIKSRCRHVLNKKIYRIGKTKKTHHLGRRCLKCGAWFNFEPSLYIQRRHLYDFIHAEDKEHFFARIRHKYRVAYAIKLWESFLALSEKEKLEMLIPLPEDRSQQKREAEKIKREAEKIRKESKI